MRGESDSRAAPPPAEPWGEGRGYGPISPQHPIGGEMSDVARGIFSRLRLPRLLQRYAEVPVLAVFSCVNGFVSIGLMAALAAVTKAPLVFPSLGPTAFLFFYTPRAASAAPRNTLIGHSIAIAVAYVSLLLTGLTDAGPAISGGVTLPRALAAALSLGLTAGLMVLARAPHPPAGATTLIVSLGIVDRPPMLLVLLGGVALLTLQAIVINRLAGIDYPLWAPRQARAAARAADDAPPHLAEEQARAAAAMEAQR
ncbi:HPP family protein [Sorangium sp. So ce1153]|uniref:HPP family protein n=1 Tax=Sorangium sp. So ce1153 TaxID=3133333 RepID=UPI003F6309C1